MTPTAPLLLTPEDLDSLSHAEVLSLIHDWSTWARTNQLPPDHPASSLLHSTTWETWLALAGRGWGKTRTGAEQVLRWVEQGYRRIHIVAPTTADTRDVCVDGESGILSVAHPSKRPIYEPSKRKLTFPNGSSALLFSAEEPERLRGPQCYAAWCDEIAAWQYPQETWDQLMFGLRLGRLPQVFVSTTPKPIPLLRKLIAESKKDPLRTLVSSGSTYENRANLAKPFFKQVAQYEGTRLGRQELHAELIDPRESGIISESWFRIYPNSLPTPAFELIIQSYDTAFTEKTLDKKSHEPDPSAATTWGIFKFTALHRATLSPAPPTYVQYGALLLDAWSDHLGFPELRAKVKKEYDGSYYGPDDLARRADVVLIEDKGSGISLRQELQTAGIPVVKYNPGRADKVQRLHVISHIPCHGLVFLPESTTNPGKARTWCEPMVDQVTTVPLADNDDLADTFSQAMAYAKDQGWLIIDEPEEEDEYADPATPPAHNPYAA